MPEFSKVRTNRFVVVAVAGLALAACEKKVKIDPLAGGGGLSGSWTSADGVFTAELKDGRFVSRANDTGEVLSEGRYLVQSSESIQLSWHSRARNEQSTANCARVGVGLLNCTDQAGRTFSLRKAESQVTNS